MSARWQVRDALAQSEARALLEAWQPGGAVVALAKGTIGLLDLVVGCLEQLGPDPCDVWLASWAIGAREGRRLAEVVRGGRIRRLQLLTDASIVRRCPAESALLRELFGAEVIRLSEMHAKLAIVRGPARVFVILSSANLNAAVRLESFIVLDDPGVADYLARTIGELHSRALAWDATGQGHREHFERWRTDASTPAPTRRRRARRGPGAFVSDALLGDDVRRPGVTAF